MKELPVPGGLDGIGAYLRNRYTRTGAVADLEEAITIARQAVEATPKDHPDRAGRLNNLGIRLGDRYTRTGAAADLEEAKKHYRTALNAKEAAISLRIQAGRRFLSTQNALEDLDDAYNVSKAAVDLIPLLAPLSLQSADKQHQLREAVGLASDAAAIALHSRDTPFAALRLLEIGRGVLAGSLQSIRTDLSALQQTHPQLASAFVDLRDKLDGPASRTSPEPPQLALGLSTNVEGDRRHKASADMDRLLGEIREKPGFEQFLTSATEDQMRAAAADGPLIVVNTSSHRCDAFIVECSGIRVLPLPQLTLAGVAEHAPSLQPVETLAWLWDVVVGPVLDALRYVQTPAGDTWPHIWWVPTGPLTRFPLHAAGHYRKRTAETALDRVASSYSSSIKAILYTRQQRRQNKTVKPCPDVVLVGIAETPKQSGLGHAANEIDAVRNVCESVQLPCLQPSACKQGVLSALETCRILHFAGHGGTRNDPLQSLLLLNDWQESPLTVESLLETNLSAKAPFLAYLSACGTGRIRDERSVDESIHLTSAFQLAGFRHVIGTLWEVDDELCVEMAKLMYEYLGKNGLCDESVSRGLHQATRTLRDRWLGQQQGTGAQRESAVAGFRDAELGIRDAELGIRDAELCDVAQQHRPLWVPYIHFGV
ncbi:TPR domain-containing protein [Diaporthe sp. PMI_573]|nr:TPR domain-containing protein [Diaporthaceae sp. PMI_573]